MRPVALITGASSGIGAAFARHLARRGFHLVLVARRAAKLEELAGKLGGNTTILAADLTTAEGLHAVEELLRGCESLEMLVNNAGFGTLGRFWEADVEGQERMHRLHVLATMRLTHAALRGMTRRGHGAIVNVSSVAGFSQGPGSVSYCATKAWMNNFTEGLYVELRQAHSAVKVQALCPGYTETEFHDALGVERGRIPRFLWMTADRVVEESLRGLDRGDVFVIPGWIYRLTVAALRYLPKPLLRRFYRPFADKRV